ncbi:OmpA family protein [Corallococcus terminator]
MRSGDAVMMRALRGGVLFLLLGGALASGCGHAPQARPAPDGDGDGVSDADDACPLIHGPVTTRGCPIKDTDGDGLDDSVDKCPRHAGPAFREGCPARDFDDDGVEDSKDACPRESGLLERKGCPIVDPDRDGVEGAADACPEESGPVERQGCPEKDEDGDGVPDEDDACPRDEGVPHLRGCPERDRDGDGQADHRDNCPTTYGPGANQGCPAQDKQRVVLLRDKLELQERITFESQTAKLQASSHALLDNVARVLLAHPELTRVIVEGHTDAWDDETTGRAVTQARAESVVAYLEGQGVPKERLEAQGMGADKPLESSGTSLGRTANRRVEFTFPPPPPRKSSRPAPR